MTKPWEDAAHRGNIETLGRLLADGADIDARDAHGQTALMIAAMEGHSDLVAWLVRKGADLNRTAKYRLSALMLAVIRGHADSVRILVAAGADLHLRGTGAPGFDGKTALDLAIARAEPEVLQILNAGRNPGNS